VPDPRANEILTFWFSGGLSAARNRWFLYDPQVLAEIRHRFGSDIERAGRGELDAWIVDPTGVLAVVVLLDPFNRYINRDSPLAFAYDDVARAATLRAMSAGLDRKLDPIARGVLYLPLMHAEDREAQRASVSAYKALADSAARAGAGPEVISHVRSMLYLATRNAAIVERFGRFPDRNALLGRTTTSAEQEFLGEPSTLRDPTA
jgi:uncharacterized protein (DUF924 family)